MAALKPVEDVTACVVDYGSFLSVAEKLAETMKRVYYHSPYDTEFQDIKNCIKGCGLERVKRLDEYLSPEMVDEIDLFVFPDIGYGGPQKLLRALGKPVWGHLGAADLELYRSVFYETIENLGLPVISTQIITGLSDLADYLKSVEGKWVKIDRYRANMETWHHRDWTHSERTLEALAVILGGAKENVTFVVADELPCEIEIGYDGWSIDGTFPSRSFQGYEKKNELYLGSVLADKDLPDELKLVNRKMAPILKKYGYRDWWACEVRVVKGQPYFIDPTTRMPGQTGEHQLETITNFADIIWHGAQGILLEPEMEWPFAAEATLHMDKNVHDPAVDEEWKSLKFPKEVLRWVKLYHYCKVNGVHLFPPHHTDEVGVVLGVGNTTDEAIDHLMENLELMKELPVHAETHEFASLLNSIKDAESRGIKFGGRIPTPESVIRRELKRAG